MRATLLPRLTSNRRLMAAASAGALLALLAVAVGALLGFTGALITVAVLAALALALWALSSIEVGMWGAVAVICLLPWGALPVKIVVTPTFLDLALGGVMLTYLMQWMTGRRRRLNTTPLHGPIAAFALLAVFSFVAGLKNGPLTPNLIRHFGELLLSIGMTLVVVDTFDSTQALARLVRVIVLAGAGAAVLGLILYGLPQNLAERLLSSLAVFNYPSGNVLRYIEDNPDLARRAISTSVDPNVLGGLLAIVGGLLAPQLLAERTLPGSRRPPPDGRLAWGCQPYAPDTCGNRGLAWVAFAVVLGCLVLTYSRGAMAALAVALAGVGLVKYRRALPLLALVGLALALLPWTQVYVAHLLEGVRVQDLATQMRLGEYKDAFILISRYPFGVGFAGAPDIDIYLGVSSAYLLVAEAMGLPGLLAFLAVMAGVYLWAFQHRRRALADPELAPLWLGAHAGLAAALAVGVLDHYFFNIEFQPASAIFWIMVGLCLATTRLARSAGTAGYTAKAPGLLVGQD